MRIFGPRYKFSSWTLIAYLSIFSAGAFASPVIVKKNSSEQTKNVMHEFLSHLTVLKRFLVSESAFVDPKNAPEISTQLKEFARAARASGHDPQLETDNFKFSQKVLENHISETERVFNLGNKSYARWMLNSTISVCMSCHTQVPIEGRGFEEFSSIKNYATIFDQAEFLFATRSFVKALELYDKVITGYGNGKNSINELETSLSRQVTYYARIKRDPEGALLRLRAYLKSTSLPISMRANVNAWIEQFKQWSSQADLDPGTATEKQIVEFAEKSLNPDKLSRMEALDPNLVAYLRVSGVLYEYLKTHSSVKVVPDVLYWLAVCERSIQPEFFYSLADIYLRECITQYPAAKIAKKCLKEYEDQMTLGYTGSSGTHVPTDVHRDLIELKKLIESGGKIKSKLH